ncbi:alpha/beta fold hydrolase [uncultured Thermanaerothrix sp.]|uniref:alpha/beta fold hydrolase n=1 Tax=uncultured Thermanaerothrix sp. TaxID=1195149 RepID=UPI002611B937|nr:alpha/beta fold hydrolase [uncultured Thermanaerothrix sp.]
MKTKLRILLGLLFVGAIGIGIFLIWALTPLGPMPEAQEALQSDAMVEVQQGQWLVFVPRAREPRLGLIWYPGGRVDYRSYAPMAHAIAGQGYLTVIVPMPLNLAVLSPEAAQKVIAAYPHIATWVIGGHSLGGAMAAAFVYEHPQEVQGLILMAAYPASNRSLRLVAVPVLSIAASEDGLSTPQKMAASRSLLPETTQWVVIEGGNHAGFGWYGDQAGDGLARIPREAQQQQVIEAVAGFLEAIGKEEVP